MEKFKTNGEDSLIDEILSSQQEVLKDFNSFNDIYKVANFLFIINHLGFLPVLFFREISIIELTFAVLGLNEVFLICYSGQLISNKLEDLENAIWNCEWTCLSLKSKKKILTMLTMTQNVKTMKSGPFTLNFETYKEILVNIYSILTAVKSIM